MLSQICLLADSTFEPASKNFIKTVEAHRLNATWDENARLNRGLIQANGTILGHTVAEYIWKYRSLFMQPVVLLIYTYEVFDRILVVLELL